MRCCKIKLKKNNEELAATSLPIATTPYHQINPL
jgi:hypothetical protein